jgi:hypothetical protein
MGYYVSEENLNEIRELLKVLSHLADLLSLGNGLSYDAIDMLKISNKTNNLMGKLSSCQKVQYLDDYLKK